MVNNNSFNSTEFKNRIIDSFLQKWQWGLENPNYTKGDRVIKFAFIILLKAMKTYLDLLSIKDTVKLTKLIVSCYSLQIKLLNQKDLAILGYVMNAVC